MGTKEFKTEMRKEADPEGFMPNQVTIELDLVADGR